jgi:aminobenzoyl-glutamate utilization protein B
MKRTISIIPLLVLIIATACHAASSEQKQYAFDAIERNAEPIAVVGDSLYYFGELGMQEFESARFLKQTLEDIGFKVEQGGAGMPTNIWAQWGSGKPKLVIVTEIDALPEGSQTPGSIPRKPIIPGAPGHMEGHNTHGAVAVAAAYALKKTMERYKLPGTIALSFGPAEEQLISRPIPRARGLFQRCRRGDPGSYRRQPGDRLRIAELCGQSARSSPSTAKPRTAQSLPGKARTRSMRSSS